MTKRTSGWAVACALTGALLAADARAEGERCETIKIGTLAPAESPWGQVLKVWQRAVRERTKLPEGTATPDGKDHTLDLVFFWNGAQGDEAAAVAKMKSGQLDGAAVTAVGLAQVHKPVLVLQLPGLFRDWDSMDRAKAALIERFRQAFDEQGFFLARIGDVGMAHTMTKGFELRTPADVRGHHPYVWRDDPIGPVVMQIVGGVTAVPLGVPEVLPNLGSGALDVVTAPSLAAEQLQWASRLDHISTNVSGMGVGALLLTKKKLEALSADERAVLKETGKVASDALDRRIRSEEEAAYGRLVKKMTPYSLTQSEQAEWADVFRQTRARLAQGTFPRDLVEAVESLAGQR